MNSCCIAYITYEETLIDYKEKSFLRCLNVFGNNWPIKLIIPENISVKWYEQFNDKIEICKVPANWLESRDAYNQTCCSSDFYMLFNDYDYVLIYQTDVWCFYDNLEYYLSLNYDWYGAPWGWLDNSVGNGGFSLRKVNKMISITSRYTNDENINEDGWFCCYHTDELKKCPYEIASNFSYETVSVEVLNAIKYVPMAIHGIIYGNLNLWDDDGTKFLDYKKMYLS